MRKNGEMSSYSSQIREQLQQGSIVSLLFEDLLFENIRADANIQFIFFLQKFAPATYTNVIPHAGILFAGLLDLFGSCFEDFRCLSNEKQVILWSFEEQ